MTKPNHCLWPARVRMRFYSGRGKTYFESTDRWLDLSDSLMGFHCCRTVYLGMATTSTKWPVWSEQAVSRIENLIRNDLCFDGYRVSIVRLDEASDASPCSAEFHWKLMIRTRY